MKKYRIKPEKIEKLAQEAHEITDFPRRGAGLVLYIPVRDLEQVDLRFGNSNMQIDLFEGE